MDSVIFDRLEELTRLLTTKGIVAPDPEITLASSRVVRGYIWANGKLPGETSTSKGFYRYPTAKEAIDAMFEWTHTLPSIEDHQKAVFIRKIADAIDYGNEHGFEIGLLQTHHTNLLAAPS